MASGLTPNSTNIDRVGRGVAQETSTVVHPEYMYWRSDWMKLRDVLAGQKEVKRKAQIYLPMMKGMEKEDYAGYLDRATFYNMASQTQTGMLGQVFRKDPYIRNLPPKFDDTIRTRFAKDGSGHVAFCKTVLSEQIGLGRFGVLVDAPAEPTTEPTSFAIGYTAENILDWRVEEVNGFFTLTRVLLREFTRNVAGTGSENGFDPSDPRYRPLASQRGIDGGAARAIASKRATLVAGAARWGDNYTYETQYRELTLEQEPDGSWVYHQYIYKNDPGTVPTSEVTPVIRGIPLDFIPFKFFGAQSNTEAVERSPLLDIADLNLSHYRTYAELEYGRLFTALPVYYAPGADGDGVAEYHIGPNTVWEVPSGETPGILEFHGTGLKALETALSTKESQIAAIGGRLLPGLNKVSESGNQTVLREANEQAVLLNCIMASEFGMTDVIRWWLMFRDIALADTTDLEYEINQEFLSTPIGAREIRAIQMLYLDGIIPAEVLYDYLLRASVIPTSMTLVDFKTALKDPNSFINNPEAQARQRGFTDRKEELAQAQIAREADFQQQELDLQNREVVLMEKQPIVLPPAPPKPASAALPAPPKGAKIIRPGNVKK